MKRIGLIWLIVLNLLLSCNAEYDNENQVFCTLEFRIVSVEVMGGELTSYYTINESTQDTLYMLEQFQFQNSYPILTDNEHELFINNEPKSFLFVGFVDDEKVIEEPYLIESDRCHVVLIEGNTSIEIEL